MKLYVVPPALKGVFKARELRNFKLVFAECDQDGGGTIDHDELQKVPKGNARRDL
jgi:Ca2+-binding EF-hand superfamily protein